MNNWRLWAVVWTIIMLVSAPVFSQDEPALPAGLGGEPPAASPEPALPSGLNGAAAEPSLPSGLTGDSEDGGYAWEPEPAGPVPLRMTGFYEVRAGGRIKNDPYQHDTSILEARLQLEFDRTLGPLFFNFTGDVLYDEPVDQDELDLESGTGWFDLRTMSFSFSPLPDADVKFGRQILTWGTGDLLFINDLFPKDWQSFFIGRDDEYLKAPSDAVKLSFYQDCANVDIVYTPRFDPDRFINGTRISYWNGTLGRRAGNDAVIPAARPEDWFRDHEVALRLYKTIGGDEWAVYGYRGYWKSPGGQTAAGRAIYPDLFTYGMSYRGTMGQGIGNIEAGYYDSLHDRSGDNPLIKNSEFRFLAGYEQELAKNFTGGFQYYCEYMMDYGEYLASLPASSRAAHEYRHLITTRLTRLMWEQNLRLSLFTYFSPSESDAYFRPKAHYKIDDSRAVEIGANVFTGDYDHTFFGQFDMNTNLYAAYRYSF